MVTRQHGMHPLTRIVQLTDTHFMPLANQPLHGVFDTEAAFDAVLDQVGQWAPDIVVVTGDLSEQGDPGSYQRLRPKLSSLGVPVYVVPGNHDHTPTLKRELIGDNVLNSPRVDLGQWNLIFVDTRLEGHPHGELSPEELTRLDHSLAASEGRPKLVFLHHPPVPVGSAWMDAMALKNPEALFERLDSAEVRAVICGHVHQEFTGRHQGIPVLTTPSTGFQLLPDQPEFAEDLRPPGFRWILLDDDGGWQTGVQRIDRTADSFHRT